MKCKNCGHDVNGNFCHNCGQKSTVTRVNLPNFISELSESVFQVNRGFFYTVKEMSLRPGRNLEEYLNGKRKDHFKPIPYLLTISALYFLITQITNQNTWMDNTISGFMEGATAKDSTDEWAPIALWFAKNYAYTSLILLPIFSFASYLSFRKFGRNYLEHIVINSYITGHQALLYSLSAILMTIGREYIIEFIAFMVSILYTFWVFWQLFTTKKRATNILRTILTYTIYLTISLVFLSVLAGISGL